MMAKKSPCINVCDEEGHHDMVADAFCRYHKKLLCLNCVVEKTKAHSPECFIIPIRDALKEKDLAILDCLSIRQISKRKHKLIEEHEVKVDKVKSDLKQRVNETYAKISTRLDALRDKCLISISEQAQSITGVGESNKKRLQEIETNLNEYIETLSKETVDSFDEVQSKIKHVKKEINEKIPDKDSVPQGEFRPDETFQTFIMQSGTSLGEVNVIDPDHYEDVENQNVSKHIDVSSDEVDNEIDKNKLSIVGLDAGNDQGAQGGARSPTKSSDNRTEKKQHGIWKFLGFGKEKPEMSQIKKRELESVIFSEKGKTKKDSKRPVSSPVRKEEGYTEEIYKDVTFAQPAYKAPKYLINKTIHLKIKQEDITSACKFSKLVGLGKSYVGLLSDIHKNLIFVGTEGQFLGRKQFKASKVAITAIGNADVAVLTEPNCLTRKFRVSEKGFETTGSFMVNNISNVTGFDYDLTSSMYAVSTYDKIIILDKTGKQIKCVQHSAGTNNILTAFDFKTECLYILKINENTLKSFSLKKSAVVWKRKMDSESVLLRSMCLHRDKICLACKDAVAIFSTETGQPIVKHEINDLLDDCLGICVIDDVLVLSSNSDNIEKSTSIAYISL